MSITMTQIAKEVGVSVGVVSRLLREDPTLSISTQRRQAILAAVERAGGIAVRPRRKPLTRVVLVPFPDSQSPQWIERNTLTGERWGQCKKALEAAGFALHITLLNPEDQEAAFTRLVQERRQADGILLVGWPTTPETARLLWADAFPHVSFHLSDERLGLHSVRAHLEEGVRQGVCHLAGLGHHRIAFVGSRDSQTYAMLLAAQAQCRLPIDQQWDCPVPPLSPETDLAAFYEQAYTSASRWLESTWPQTGVTAVVAQDDRAASAMLQALVDRGLRPGHALSVLGCGNQRPEDIHPQATPVCGITTVDNPFGRVGRRAAELLLNQILHGQHPIVHERIPTQLLVRASTGPATPAPIHR